MVCTPTNIPIPCSLCTTMSPIFISANTIFSALLKLSCDLRFFFFTPKKSWLLNTNKFVSLFSNPVVKFPSVITIFPGFIDILSMSVLITDSGIIDDIFLLFSLFPDKIIILSFLWFSIISSSSFLSPLKIFTSLKSRLFSFVYVSFSKYVLFSSFSRLYLYSIIFSNLSGTLFSLNFISLNKFALSAIIVFILNFIFSGSSKNTLQSFK